MTNDGLPFRGTAFAQLEQQFLDEWLSVGKAVRAKADGAYSIGAVSEDLKAEISYRVTVPNGEKAAATSAVFTIELGAGKHTAFKLMGARWKPCDGEGLASKRKIKYGIIVPVLPSGSANEAAAIADVEAWPRSPRPPATPSRGSPARSRCRSGASRSTRAART